MKPVTKSDFQAIPAFAELRSLVIENIGFFPEFHYDSTGTAGHSIRKYADPAAVQIRYSERALLRYLRLTDIVAEAIRRRQSDLIASGLCLLRGGELLRQNRFVGLAFIANAFEGEVYRQLPRQQTLGNAFQQATQNSVIAITSLLFPLAHEIGHLSQSQSLAPKGLYTDAILETYALNYQLIKHITGEFDYATSLSNPTSPLGLTVLREEAASDYFAVATITHLALRLTPRGSPYPLSDILNGLLSFPMIMGLESVALCDYAQRRDLQDKVLAMHCRFSIIIDTVRAFVKSLIADRNGAHRYIDSVIDEVVAEADSNYDVLWDGCLQYLLKRHNQLSSCTAEGALTMIRAVCGDIRKRLALAELLSATAEDVQGYCIRGENKEHLQHYSDVLRTFESITIDGDRIVQLKSCRPE